MRLRSRKRERPLSARNSQRQTTLKSKLRRPLIQAKNTWRKILKADNGISVPSPCITRSQNNLNLKSRTRAKIAKSMEKPLELPLKKNKPKEEAKKPIFQTVVRNSAKDMVTSTTKPKTQNDKVTTTTKTKLKDVRTTKSAQLRQSSLNRELRKTESISSALSSPRKTRRMDKPEKSASLNNSPIRKVRQLGLPSLKLNNIAVSSTNESPKKRIKPKAPTVPEQNNDFNDDNDVTMYEPHTTTFDDFPIPKTVESDIDGQVGSSELCLPNDCFNDLIAIAECARIISNNLSTDEDINLLADKAAKVMTTDKDDKVKKCTDKKIKQRSSGDLEMYQPTSTTDDLDVCTDFLNHGDKYVQVRFISNFH